MFCQVGKDLLSVVSRTWIDREVEIKVKVHLILLPIVNQWYNNLLGPPTSSKFFLSKVVDDKRHKPDSVAS